MELKNSGVCLILIGLLILCGHSALSKNGPIVQPQIRNESFPGSFEGKQVRAVTSLARASRLDISVPQSQQPAMVAMRIVGPVEGFRVTSQDGVSAGDLETLVDQLTQGLDSDRERAEALFHFVVTQIKDWYYPAQGINLTVEDLGSLIWDFGFGFCYDLGRLMAGLWAEAGLRSRIVGWPTHTVAEVYYDQAWHLYDLQHRSFYEKHDGQVASFAELKADPSLFYQGLNEFGLDAIGYPPHHMAHWYQKAKPNFQDSKQGPHWKKEKSFSLNLSEGSYFEILFCEPTDIYHPTSWHQYYGEQTAQKEPPWPLQGRLIYAPAFVGKRAKWETCRTPEGKPGICVRMKSPYLFTRAWLKIPSMEGFSRIWVEADSQTFFAGRLVGGNAEFSKYVEGSNEFKIILDEKEVAQSQHALEKLEIHTRVQMSPIGMPHLKPGRNLIPIEFDRGHPQVSLWFRDSAPDLDIESLVTKPKNPKPGDVTLLRYTVSNNGTSRSQPTVMTVFNNVTAFLAETIEKVGEVTIPPIGPGKRTTVEISWIASTRMTWYGQNPYVQLLDAWIDMAHDRPDPNRDNNRLKQFVLLSTPEGALPALPGYRKLP